MRALKSILGSPLIDEETSLGGRKVPLTHVVEIFIRNLKEKAEAFAGREIASVVLGRPVRFVDDDDQADARAQPCWSVSRGRPDSARSPSPTNRSPPRITTSRPCRARSWSDCRHRRRHQRLLDRAGRAGATRARGSQRRRAGQHRRAHRRHRPRHRAQPRFGDAAAGARHAARREEPADAERALSPARHLGDDQLRLHLPERARGRRAGVARLRAREGLAAPQAAAAGAGPSPGLHRRGCQDRVECRGPGPIPLAFLEAACRPWRRGARSTGPSAVRRPAARGGRRLHRRGRPETRCDRDHLPDRRIEPRACGAQGRRAGRSDRPHRRRLRPPLRRPWPRADGGPQVA